MIHNFEGQYKSRRKIQLGGSNFLKKKDELLKEAFYAREKRASDQKQAISILLIQKTIRSWLLKRREIKRTKMEWKVKALNTDGSDIEFLVLSFSNFFNCNDDDAKQTIYLMFELCKNEFISPRLAVRLAVRAIQYLLASEDIVFFQQYFFGWMLAITASENFRILMSKHLSLLTDLCNFPLVDDVLLLIKKFEGFSALDYHLIEKVYVRKNLIKSLNVPLMTNFDAFVRREEEIFDQSSYNSKFLFMICQLCDKIVNASLPQKESFVIAVTLCCEYIRFNEDDDQMKLLLDSICSLRQILVTLPVYVVCDFIAWVGNAFPLFLSKCSFWFNHTFVAAVFECINEYPSAIVTLSDALSRLLYTMSQEEMRNEQFSLNTNQLVAFSSVLLEISMRFFSQKVSSRKPPLDKVLNCSMNRIIKALCQIHLKDQTYHFCPSDHWNVNLDWFKGLISMDAFDEEANHHDAFKVEFLINLPFLVPFEIKVLIFRDLINQESNLHFEFERGPVVRIRRDQIFHDGFSGFHSEKNWRKRFRIEFVDSDGFVEEGIDGGGVYKEFMNRLTKVVFDPNYGFFEVGAQGHFFPSMSSYVYKPKEFMDYYSFIGKVIGKALYDNILLDIPFAAFFLRRWIDQGSSMDDLHSVDPDLYRNLLFLKNYPGDVSDLSLSFTISDTTTRNERNLIPNGSQIDVTNENRLHYIFAVANDKLNNQIRRQTDAFLQGLSQVINRRYLKMFYPHELQILLSGTDTPINIAEWKENTVYHNGYNENHQTIIFFWNAVEEMTEDQKRKLVRFVTSCSRPPLLGFKVLSPKFAISMAVGDGERLPSSSTCINLLKLYPFESKERLKEKLLYAIQVEAGFYLS